MLKRFIISKLQLYARAYFAAHPDVTLIVVVGSVGKTTTKHMLYTLLSQTSRVRMQRGNHNTEVSVPLALLGVEMPKSLTNPWLWLQVFREARRRIKQPADVDVVIQELGTDHPGDIAAFGHYLTPDLAVVTAITPEHMEFFGTIEAVAQEELSVAAYSKQVLVNRDDIDEAFLQYVDNSQLATFGTSVGSQYRFEQSSALSEEGYFGVVTAPELSSPLEVAVRVVGEHSLRPVVGAIAAALKMGLTPEAVVNGVATITPVAGRMNMLKGLNNTTIIDDTYNSSPAAAVAALKTLYSFASETRIAVLGDMRELGATSPTEHEALGAMCDPSRLSWLVAVGPDMEKYAVPAAQKRGCNVHIARDALAAADFVRTIAQPGAVILVKGSQNTIYLEECVKSLVDPALIGQLVRQTPAWMTTKNTYFQSLS